MTTFSKLEKQITTHRSSRALIAIGFIAIIVSFLVYANNDTVTPAAIKSLQRLAVSTYVMLLVSFAAIGFGLYKLFKEKIGAQDGSTLSIIASAINNKRSKQVFLASMIGYAIFFTITSGTLLYKPDLKFTDYGVPPPMAELSPCCNPQGTIGYMPMILATFTEHIGLQIIPLNLVLLILVSFLVGLNFALSVKTFSMTKNSKLGSVGAVTGLFVGCPTCAGTAFFILFGLGASASATSATIFLTTFQTQLQTIFIAISIPVLAATIWIMARTIRKSQMGSCAIDSKQ